MSPSAARGIRVAAGGAPESVFSQPPLPEVIGEALTRAPVCRPEEHVVVSGPLRQRRRSARSEVVRREARPRQVRRPPPSTVWS
ncbi:hypothetical protein EVAR_57029_1 [Eumeta japonica]|uniref:Uncharacterized protein n=1 Tax=Eumeta variegata TaxID=151549 RepID=A0A4C2AGM0_EUMVA|nr:hypothetical protein EVAR_57029_1 [Eumeta japonica]